MKYLIVCLCLFIFSSCKESAEANSAQSNTSTKNSTEEPVKLVEDVHVHGPGCKHKHFELKAPNGGTLVKLGGDAAVIEVLLDNNTGELKVNVFDGLAKEQLKIEQKELKLKIQDVFLALKADEQGVFKVTSDILKGMQRFEAELGELEIEGLPFDGTLISYPEGN